MNTIPLWVPLLVAGIGLLGTIVGTVCGVLITQRRSDRREVSTWERERRRDHELWAREDHLRTFDQRRDAYITFYEALREMARSAYDHGMGLSHPASRKNGGELPFEWNQVAFQKLEHLRIYASPEVLAAADSAYGACWRWGQDTTHGHDDKAFYDRQEVFDSAELLLYDSIRRDLGLPSVLQQSRPLVGSGWLAEADAEG